jgi:hypothetical protein|tara:strand:+ start:82 stop:477 length:396 start_codon:yes stop_codon:yes gene_type:complete
MAKQTNPTKSFLTPKWLIIKEMYKTGTNGSEKYGTNFPTDGELNVLSTEFVEILGELTRKFGFESTIEEIHMNLWKERIWSLIENAGLLPEIAWRDDLDDEEDEYDRYKWDKDEDEDYEVDLEVKEKEIFG